MIRISIVMSLVLMVGVSCKTHESATQRDVVQSESGNTKATEVKSEAKAVKREPVGAVGNTAAVLWESNIDGLDVGELPDEYLVLGGLFSVSENAGSKWFTLAGTPLGNHGLLLPSTTKKANAIVAGVKTAKSGRRYSTFGVGLNGVGGFALLYSGARDQLEIVQEDVVIAKTQYKWVSGEWYMMKMDMIPKGGHWVVRGKMWLESGVEPDDWMITYQVDEKPLSGRAMLWGLPYAGKPIHYRKIKTYTESK